MFFNSNILHYLYNLYPQIDEITNSSLIIDSVYSQSFCVLPFINFDAGRKEYLLYIRYIEKRNYFTVYSGYDFYICTLRSIILRLAEAEKMNLTICTRVSKTIKVKDEIKVIEELTGKRPEGVSDFHITDSKDYIAVLYIPYTLLY